MLNYLKLRIFSLNVLFSTSLIILFLLIKDQITSYLNFLKEASPKLLELQAAIQNNVTENIATLQSSLKEIIKTASGFFWFQYVLMPLLILVLFILFQGYIFYLLSNSKDLKKYLIRFSIITIPAHIILLLVLFSFNSFIPAFLFLILVYYILVLYLNLDKPIKKALKESLNSCLKIKPFLIYLLILFLIIIYLILKFVVIISILGQIEFSRFLITLVMLLLSIFLITMTEIWFSKKVLTW